MNVAVVGSINMDVVARVAHVPLPGETLLARSSSRGGGGKGANQAVAAARARGASVAFIGAVGDDGDGQALRAALEADGIDVTGLESSDSPTGVALISVADDGENAIVVIAGANAADAALSERQRELVSRADVVIAQLEIPAARVLEAARLRSAGSAVRPQRLAVRALRRRGARGRAALRRRHRRGERARAARHHAESRAGPVSDAIDALAERVGALVVTLGAEGSVIAVGAERRSVRRVPGRRRSTRPAPATRTAASSPRSFPTGRAALTVDVLADAARVAGAAAALAVGRHGAQGSVPTAAEVDSFLEEAS